MDILVISDSHGRDTRIESLLDGGVSPGAIFFLGDGLRDLAWVDTKGVPVYSVRGNCDAAYANEDDELLIELCTKRIFASHGHRYSVKLGYNAIIKRAISLDADIVLFGHTHCPFEKTFLANEDFDGVTLKKKLCVLNPGSLGYDGSFGTVVIRNGEVLTAIGKL